MCGPSEYAQPPSFYLWASRGVKCCTGGLNEKEVWPCMRGQPVCSPGSWSGRGWLPLKKQNDTEWKMTWAVKSCEAHKQNINNNNLKLTEIAAFSEVINVWLTCPVAQHKMTTCKVGHNVSCYEDDCFKWVLTSDIDQPIVDLLSLTVSIVGGGAVYLAADLQMSSENLNSILGGKLELKFTIKLNIWNLRS